MTLKNSTLLQNQIHTGRCLIEELIDLNWTLKMQHRYCKEVILVLFLTVFVPKVFSQSITWDWLGHGDHLTYSLTNDGDQYGYSVATNGEYVMVGSAGDDVYGTNQGSVTIFHIESWGASGVGKITGDADKSGNFGHAIDMHGNTAIISGAQGGYVYVFELNNSNNWVQTAQIAPKDYWGWNDVAISEEYLIIGDSYYLVNNDPNRIPGAAHIYKRTATGWQKDVTLLPEQGSTGFGGSVDIDGEFAVVGDRAKDKAYFYKLVDGEWIETQVFYRPDTEGGSSFGQSVALHSGYALVGAPDCTLGESGPWIKNGFVSMFEYRNGEWIETNVLTDPGYGSSMRFGQTVSISDSVVGLIEDAHRYELYHAG